jgi:hypothetical protein
MPAPVAFPAALSDISPLMRNQKHSGDAGDRAAMHISPTENHFGASSFRDVR